MKKDRVEMIKKLVAASLIGSSLIVDYKLVETCKIIDRQKQELIDQHYYITAGNVLEDNVIGDVTIVNNDVDIYTSLEKDQEVTNGEYLYKYLLNNQIKFLVFDNQYYTIDGRNVYVYFIDNTYKVLNEDEFKYLNGICRYVNTLPYDYIKDYSVYYDVDNKETVEVDGKVYYSTTRKLIKK